MKTLSTILRFTMMTQGAAVARRRDGRVGWGGAILLGLAALAVARPAYADGTYLPVITADFNHDGIPDVLIPSTSGPTATVSLGTLSGMFGRATGVTLPAVCTQAAQGSMVVGDFNGDGLSDIAFFCVASGGVGGVLLSNGDGTFATPKTLAGLYPSSAVVGGTSAVVGDFDHDGKLDLAILGSVSASSEGQGIQFFHGNGDGTFAAAVFTAFAQDSNYSSPVAVDVNNDGYADIVLGSFTVGAPTLSVFGNNKDGTFGTLTQGVAAASVSTAVGTQGQSTDGQILVGNFFGATGTDFAVPDTGSTPGFFLVKNTSSGTTFSLGTAGSTTFPALKGGGVGSFTGSGFSDLVAADGANLTVLVNDGSGNFTASYASLTMASLATVFAVADANGDGYSDIYTAVAQTGSILTSVSLVNGSATATSQPISLTVGTKGISAVWTGDVNFKGATATGTQVVNPAAQIPPTLTWATPPSISFGTPLGATQLDAAAVDAGGAAIPGTFVYSPVAGTILDVGVHTLSVTFTPTDTVTYSTATQTVSLIVVGGSSGTTLAVSSGGSPVTSVAAGSVVTLTATVVAGTLPVTPGVVNFCDASAVSCTDIHLLGSAQLTSAGTAVLRFVPAIGKHSYKAVFVGTANSAGGGSGTSAITVTGTYPSTTTISSTGSVGAYGLTATTIGSGGNTSPTGAVSFLDQTFGGRVLATPTVGDPVSAVTLGSPSTLATGSAPVYVAIGDLNGDGLPDLVSADSSSNSLTVFLGHADGTFTAAARVTTGAYPDYVAIGDFNSDGKADLAVTNYLDGTVTILLGIGDGTFTSVSSLVTGSDPRALVAGDFNGDGILDLAVSKDSSLRVFLGNGDGTFTVAGEVASGNGPNYSLVSADFDKDGKLDLAVTNAGANTVAVLLGNGDGTFRLSGSLPTGVGPNSVTLGDFNGDGTYDLVTTNGGDSSVTILLGQGNGTFVSAPTPAVGTSPRAGAVADINGDGKTDLIIANSGSNTVTVLLGKGDGTFDTPMNVPTGNYPDWVATGDFNGDGTPDVAALNLTDQTIAVLSTKLTETVTASASGLSLVGAGPHQVVASYPGDTTYAASVSNPAVLTGQSISVTVTWVPAVTSVPYGTPLGPQELDAVATDPNGAAVAGTFVYTPSAGAVLAAGNHSLTVAFTPTDAAEYTTAAASVTVNVTQAKPSLTWATPADIPYGTTLSGMQLNASATGVGGGALPGVFTYSPAAGTIPAPGTQTLSVTFAPTDAADYTTANGSVTIVVSPLSLTSFLPNVARLGDPDTKVTLTGSGFVANSVVLVNGVAAATTYVNPTMLTAVIPATDFGKVGTLQIVVSDPSISAVTAPQTFTVTPATPAVTLTGPTTTSPGSQPMVTLTISNPYPVPLTASFNLAFAPAVSPAVDDPAIQFASGGRNFTFTVAANSVIVPAIQLQAGTVAGTITVPLTLTAQGVDVTPANLVPVTIVVPKAIPTVSTTSLTRNGTQLSVAIHLVRNRW